MNEISIEDMMIMESVGINVLSEGAYSNLERQVMDKIDRMSKVGLDTDDLISLRDDMEKLQPELRKMSETELKRELTRMAEEHNIDVHEAADTGTKVFNVIGMIGSAITLSIIVGLARLLFDDKVNIQTIKHNIKKMRDTGLKDSNNKHSYGSPYYITALLLVSLIPGVAIITWLPMLYFAIKTAIDFSRQEKNTLII